MAKMLKVIRRLFDAAPKAVWRQLPGLFPVMPS